MCNLIELARNRRAKVCKEIETLSEFIEIAGALINSAERLPSCVPECSKPEEAVDPKRCARNREEHKQHSINLKPQKAPPRWLVLESAGP